MASARKWNV